MEKYSSLDQKMEKHVKDYQPGKAEFAGKEMGKANMYIERMNKTQDKIASKVKSQAHMGRYD